MFYNHDKELMSAGDHLAEYGNEEGICAGVSPYIRKVDNMAKHQGKIIAPLHLNIHEHEMNTARAIADAGYDVEFIPRIKGDRAKTADFIADGVLWEVKSPTSDKLKVVEKHVRAALHQSRDVVFDSRRMPRLTNEAIQKEVAKWADKLPSVRRLLYINRAGEVIRIK